MKKTFFIFFTIAATFYITGCIKNDPVLYTDSLAEFDATSWNANAAGVNYPIMTRVPVFNGATGSSAFTVHRTSGTIRLRVNLVGPTSKQEQTVGYRLFDVPGPTVSFPSTPTAQTPSRASEILNTSPAVAGTHFTALPGKVTIPADSTWGFIELSILDAGATASAARVVGITLDSTGTLLPSVNYKNIAIAIDQR